MLKELVDKLGSTFYVQIWEKRIRVTDIGTGKVYDDSPLVAVETKNNGKKVVAGIGNRAYADVAKRIEVINPFSHPRTLISDFVVAESLLSHIFREISGDRLAAPSPIVVVQPMEKTQGGLTTIEKRALRELALGAGAREAIVYEGEELTRHTFDYEKIKSQSMAAEEAMQIRGGLSLQWLLLALWIFVIAVMVLFGYQ